MKEQAYNKEQRERPRPHELNDESNLIDLMKELVYQNSLREFWSNTVAFDPFPSTDEPEKCPLKEFLIKFSVLIGQRPLTLDFHNFCSSTSLNYNNGKYVDHPTPKEQHEEAAVSYADLKASIDQYYDENIAHRDQTDKLIEASMSSLDRSSTTISDLYKDLNVITQFLKNISNAVKDDPATNQNINEATDTFTKISSNITEILSVKDFDFSALLMTGVELSQSALKREISSLRQDTSEIKSMMTEMYAAFQGQPSSASSDSVTLTLALTDIKANVKGENANTIIDKGKGIATESDDDPSKKLVKASSIVRPDPNEPVREEAKKIGLDPKAIKGAKASEMFKKAQDAEHAVLKRQHIKKVRKSLELRNHKYDSYMWTVSSRLKPEPITDIKIHPKIKPMVITLNRGNDGRNFEVHEPFLFGAFGISELDELREIITKKKNAVVKDLMNSLSRRYERLKKIPKELGIHSALPIPAPKQASSQSLGKKRKHIEPETRIHSFFTNEFGDQAFQRWSDINKVGMEALVSYLVAASMVKSPKNARFNIKLRKLIDEHPDQEKLKSKKVKLEALGYKMD
ncbi:hypothetical protein Tco_0886594 [Tanacetum coccineum]